MGVMESLYWDFEVNIYEINWRFVELEMFGSYDIISSIFDGDTSRNNIVILVYSYP